MLGWEFPPYVTGGLAAATAGIVNGLLGKGVGVTLLLPVAADVAPRRGLKVLEVLGKVAPRSYTGPGYFGWDFFHAVHTYAERAPELRWGETFDVIHAHEWLTAQAAWRIAERTGRPWVLHVHATELDRAGEHGNPFVEAIEREAVRRADAVVAVSRYTRDVLIRRYGADPDKVEVVHNAVDRPGEAVPSVAERADRRPVVLFLGRVTFQKGPDYFVDAATQVLARRPDVLFVVAGEGDMRPRLMQQVAARGLGRSILFTGFVKPDDARRLFAAADLYVMPSVSEPFGITALEALAQGTPVILAKGAGVGEVVRHALEVDFWDTRALAGRILAALSYPTLRKELGERGRADATRWTWDDAGQRLAELYELLRLEHA